MRIADNSFKTLDFFYSLGKLFPIMKEIEKQKMGKKDPKEKQLFSVDENHRRYSQIWCIGA